jgi:hypothetical protein
MTRHRVGEDGEAIIAFWIDLMNDASARTADRLEASRLLADRGWGRPARRALFDLEPPVGGLEHEIHCALSPERALELTRLMVELAPGAL